MGVPAFYRWLSEKYPKVVVDMLEQRNMVIDGVEIPVNLSEPNPNNLEFDNLFVDMNGLIHPCSHPEDREAPATEEEMYVNVTKYIDRLFATIRPRRLLFLAIDGVAPRAKMNQQRSRRFRAVQDAIERQKMMDDVRQEMAELGMEVPPKKGGAEWDSNVITPGTEFMHRLSLYLWFYVLDRMNKNPGWRNIKVIISDASEPGEGEHKIMNFIRSQRCQENYDPNQRHVIHGLDADLIMLALATHEPHFTILREKVTFGRKDRDKPEKSDAQKLLDAKTNHDGAALSALHPQDEWIYAKPLQALHIDTLREYLAAEFRCLEHGLPFLYDFERVIDDFVFMCFFVGNDFLPHLPSLDIRDGAIDYLIECYKEMLFSLGDYLTSPGGNVNLRQVDVILGRVGEIEEEVFRKRKEAEIVEERKREFHRARNEANRAGGGSGKVEAAVVMDFAAKSLVAVNASSTQNDQMKRQIVPASQVSGSSSASASQDNLTFNTGANQLAAKKLRDSILGKRNVREDEKVEDTEAKIVCDEAELFDDLPPLQVNALKGNLESTVELKRRFKEKESSVLDNNKINVKDNIRLHESGWKERYYQDKYKKEDIEQGGGLANMCLTYVQGLCWVLKYYYEGCPSWNWYYPFHYAPFASDLVNIDKYEIKFELSKPFRPIEQLLAVLPAESVNALPEECRWLMTDSQSPIIDIYISDAPLDPNGKHLPWLWVLLLPFVNEREISTAFNNYKDTLTLESRRKNAFGKSLIFVHQDHPVSKEYLSRSSYNRGQEVDDEVIQALKSSTAIDSNESVETQIGQYFDCRVGYGMCGSLSNPPPNRYSQLDSVIPSLKIPPGVFSDIESNHVLTLTYVLPSNVRTSSSLLRGLILRPSVLTEVDLVPRRPPRLGKGAFNMLNMLRPKGNYAQPNGYNPNNIINYNQPPPSYHNQYYPPSGTGYERYPSGGNNHGGFQSRPPYRDGQYDRNEARGQHYGSHDRYQSTQLYSTSQSHVAQSYNRGYEQQSGPPPQPLYYGGYAQVPPPPQPPRFMHSNPGYIPQTPYSQAPTFPMPSAPQISMESMRSQLAQVLHGRQAADPRTNLSNSDHSNKNNRPAGNQRRY